MFAELDQYDRELKYTADVMCAYLEGYSQVGYEQRLDIGRRLLETNDLTREQIADVVDLPVANIDALARGMTAKDIMKNTTAGQEYLANRVRQLLAEDGEIVGKAEKCGRREFVKFRERCRRMGFWR